MENLLQLSLVPFHITDLDFLALQDYHNMLWVSLDSPLHIVT